MLRKECIGKQYEPVTVNVEAGQLQLFAKSVGETRAIYLKEEAARSAGYRSILAPLTFGNTLILLAGADSAQLKSRLEALGMPLEGGLFHGEESFEYHEPIFAGDRITVQTSVQDLYEKKGGALRFAVFRTILTNQFGNIVQQVVSTAFVRVASASAS